MQRKFTLANGLTANVRRLDDESARGVGLACRRVRNVPILPRDWRFWWVISVKTCGENIHLVYSAFSFTSPARDLPLILSRDADAAADALFFVYNGEAHLAGSFSANLLADAVRDARSPKITALLSENQLHAGNPKKDGGV
jgi:hypothetical protein